QLANADRVAFISNPQETRACRFRSSITPAVPASFTLMTLGDAGEKLPLQPPEESHQELTARNGAYISQFPIPANPAGTGRLAVPGGEHVAAFETSVVLPPAVPQWSPPEHVLRDEDLKIDFFMDAQNSDDEVTVILQPRLFGIYLECRADTQSEQII